MTAAANPFPFGIVEGFYGVFYTFPERRDLIRFAGRRGCNFYLYAPKNDRQHRSRWWEPYPPRVMAEFAATVKEAREAGVTFAYGISPGCSIGYSLAHDFTRLTAKLADFLEIGVRAFSLMLDDTEPVFQHEADRQTYPGLPDAQADLANRLLAWLHTQDPACTLSFVPVEYHGRAPFSETLHQLGAALDPRIDLFYTGPEICSPVITAADVEGFARAARRAPLLWDNYPVNDLSMQPELHLAPIGGREAGLASAVRGILINPMVQAEATKIPLLTYAAYLADPQQYDPDAAWQQAAREIAGAEYAAPLALLAENTQLSCLGRGGQTLDRLSDAALACIQAGDLSGEPVRALEAYLAEIDEAGYTLKFRLENLALRNNLLTWIEILEHWMWMARFALQVLRALEQGRPYQAPLDRMIEYCELVRVHPKHAASQNMISLVQFTLQRVEQDQRARLQLGSRSFLPDTLQQL